RLDRLLVYFFSIKRRHMRSKRDWSSDVCSSDLNTVIKNNEGRQDKKLWTENQSGEKINYFKGSSERDEALFITEKIQNLIENQEYTPSDIAILYRTNAQSRAIEDTFMK